MQASIVCKPRIKFQYEGNRLNKKTTTTTTTTEMSKQSCFFPVPETSVNQSDKTSNTEQ